MLNTVQVNCQPIAKRTDLKFGDRQQQEKQVAENIASNEQQVTKPVEKFSIKRARENFYEGLKSPFQQALDHPVATGVIAGIGLGIKKLAEKKQAYQKLGIVAMAITSSMAVYNVGKGLYDLATGKTPREKENSFYDMGQGTIYGVMAVAPAKNIAAANKLTEPGENLNHLQAFKRCIVQGIPQTIKSLGQVTSRKVSIKEALSAPVALGTEAMSGHFTGGQSVSNAPQDLVTQGNVEFANDVQDVLPDSAKDLIAEAKEVVDRLSNDVAPIPPTLFSENTEQNNDN